MSNVVYALMVRDIGAQVRRDQLDSILAGNMPVDLPTQPELDEMDGRPARIAPLVPPDQWGQRITKPEDMDKLRDTWGRNPQAIRAKQALDATIGTMPTIHPKNQKGQGG